MQGWRRVAALAVVVAAVVPAGASAQGRVTTVTIDSAYITGGKHCDTNLGFVQFNCYRTVHVDATVHASDCPDGLYDIIIEVVPGADAGWPKGAGPNDGLHRRSASASYAYDIPVELEWVDVLAHGRCARIGDTDAYSDVERVDVHQPKYFSPAKKRKYVDDLFDDFANEMIWGAPTEPAGRRRAVAGARRATVAELLGVPQALAGTLAVTLAAKNLPTALAVKLAYPPRPAAVPRSFAALCALAARRSRCAAMAKAGRAYLRAAGRATSLVEALALSVARARTSPTPLSQVAMRRYLAPLTATALERRSRLGAAYARAIRAAGVRLAFPAPKTGRAQLVGLRGLSIAAQQRLANYLNTSLADAAKAAAKAAKQRPRSLRAMLTGHPRLAAMRNDRKGLTLPEAAAFAEQVALDIQNSGTTQKKIDDHYIPLLAALRRAAMSCLKDEVAAEYNEARAELKALGGPRAGLVRAAIGALLKAGPSDPPAGCAKRPAPPSGNQVEWGTFGTAPGQFDKPTDILLAGSEVYVPDSNNGRVQRFTRDGQLINTIGTLADNPGSPQDGELSVPVGAAMDGAGNLLVTDYVGNRIARFSPTGSWLGAIGAPGGEPGQFSRPSGIAVASDGTIWVVDAGNSRIQHLAADGTPIGAFGQQGTAPGQLAEPRGIALDAAGNVWVADRDNDAVYQFAADGTFLKSLAPGGFDDGQLLHPADVAFDPAGDVWVADSYNDRLDVFGPDGTFKRSIIGFGTAPNNTYGYGQRIRPMGVAVDASSSVFAADWHPSGRNRVLRFDDQK